MGNTYTQIYIHIVFAVQEHLPRLRKELKNEVQQYITGIIKNRNQQLLAINVMPDHVHILIRQKPDITISNLVRDIKSVSSKFINEQQWLKGRFRWQEGYSAFSYSQSQIERIKNYIMNQETHHRNKTFTEELVEILNKFRVSYDKQYLFK